MVKIRKYISLFLLSGLLGLVSCSSGEEAPIPEGDGFLRLGFGLQVDIRTRAVNTDNFIIIIREPGENGQQKFRSVVSQLPDIVALRSGLYVLEALSSSSIPAAAFDAPFYSGTLPLTVIKDQYTELDNITCTLQNMKVTVDYTDLLKEEFPDYSVSVTNGQKALEFAKGENRAGYFAVAPLTVTFTGFRVDGEKTTYEFQINDVAKARHHKITLDINYDYSASGLTRSGASTIVTGNVTTVK